MTNSRYAILAAFVGLAIAGSACTQKPADETTSATGAAVDKSVDKSKAATETALDATKKGLDKAMDATKAGTDRALDATGKGVATAIDQTQKAADKTKKIAGDIATKSKDFTSTTGEVMTDAWITAKVKAKFADETLLRGSDIRVDTDDHVVTLKGTVTTPADKNRAAVIARGSEGVTHVVNQLVVK